MAKPLSGRHWARIDGDFVVFLIGARVGGSNRSGIWHETYLVRAGEYEAGYANMPPFGLGKAGRLEPLGKDVSARDRLRARAKTSA